MIKVFDMFAGYGGTEFALKKAGIEHECIGFSEIDKYAVKCFEQNHKGVKNYGDCTKINPKYLPDFDLLCGGFPCQDVSIAGKRDLSKGRTNLYKEVLRIADAKKPKYMLLENVKGLLSISKDRNLRDIIISDLNKIGYDVCFKCLNSKDYGIPQNRERVWFVCKLGKWQFGEFMFPVPTDKNKLTLKDILLEEVEDKYYLTEEQIKRLINNTRGYNERMCKGDNAPTLMARDYKDPKVSLINPFSGKNSTEESGTIGTSVGSTTGKTAQILVADYRNDEGLRIRKNNLRPCLSSRKHSETDVSTMPPLIYDCYNKKFKKECNTLTVPEHNATRLYNKSTFRKLTPRECFRLMGFVNDEINLEGLSDTQCYKLAGNGWEINVVSKIFKELFKR